MPGDRPVDEPKDRGGYTDREMRLIFERAGQLDVESGSERRFTLAELREMGAQAGLDPADISTAAAAIRSEPTTGGMLGAPTRFTAVSFTRRRLDAAAVAEIVLRIREATGYHGDLRDVPGGMEWRVRHPMGQIIVDFSPKNSGTRVDVLVSREDQAAALVVGAGTGGLLIGLGTALFVGAGLDAGVAVAVGAGAVAAVASAWGSARLIWSGFGRRLAARTSSLSQMITESIDAASAEPRPPSEP
jgi:hypothetical protein